MNAVKELSYPADKLKECMRQLKAGGNSDPEEDARKRARILQEYEDGLQHRYRVPPHGIASVNKECAYPVVIGDVQSTECEGVGPKAEIPPPKPNVVCFERRPVVCKTKLIDEDYCRRHREDDQKPIMVHRPELPPRACKVKSVRFAEPVDPCARDRMDLCNFKHEDIPCECTNYHK